MTTIAQTPFRRFDRRGDVRRLHVAVVSQNMDLALDIRPRAEAEALAEAGYATTLVGGTAHPERLRELLGPRVGLSVYPLPRPAEGAAGQFRELGQSFYRLARQLRALSKLAAVDVVHAGNPPDNGWLLPDVLRSVQGGAPRFVFDQHDVAPVLLREKFGRPPHMRALHRVALRLERAAYRRADLVVFANSEYERRAAGLDLCNGPSVVVPNGWRLPVTSEANGRVRHGSPKIAYIGTMNEFDCVIHLIEALALLPGIASTQVVMAGDGSVRRQAQERAAELGIAGSIKWLGWVTDRDALGDLVHTADVCVAPERDSAFNRLASFVKIVEYMSVGAAIVAHRLPQTEELCGDCVSYAESMEPSGLAAAMQALLTDPAAAARLRAAAIARFDERIWWGNIGRPRLVEAYWEVFGIPPDSGGHVVPEFALLAEAS